MMYCIHRYGSDVVSVTRVGIRSSPTMCSSVCSTSLQLSKQYASPFPGSVLSTATICARARRRASEGDASRSSIRERMRLLACWVR